MTRALCPGCNEFVPVVRNAYWPHWATKIEQLPPLQVIVDLWPCEGSGLPMRECRECGCTELDCSRCIVKTGQPCSWAEDDLCSACVGKEVSLEDYMPGERHQRLHRFGQDLDPRDLPDPLVAPAIEAFRHEILEEDDPPVPLVGIWDPKGDPMTASKYQAEWKTFDKNEAFWEEVLVGRMIVSARYDGTNPAQTTSADGPGPVARYSIMLDTKEVVYLPGDPDWGDLDLIAPAPAGPVMQRIQRLAWDDIGIAEVVLQTGTIKLDKTWKGRGRLWIQDGWDRAGTTSGPTPGVDPIAEEVDKQILKDIEVVAQAVYRLELPADMSEDEAQRLVARVRAELETEGIKTKTDDRGLMIEYVSGELPTPKMVGFESSQDVMYAGAVAAAMRRAGVESDPKVERRMIGTDPGAGSQSFEITGKVENGAFPSPPEIDPVRRVIAHKDATEEDIRNGYTTPDGYVMLPADENGLVDIDFGDGTDP